MAENTGYKAYATLSKVTNDGTNRPLDINNNLCSESGLPQAIKANNDSDPDYIAPILDTVSCPVGSALTDIIEDNSGVCDGYYQFKVITEIDVTITVTTDLQSIATLIPVVGLPLPSGYIGLYSVSSPIVVTTNTDQGYMLGINATLFPGGGAPSFISRLMVEVTNTVTSEILGAVEFTRNHTNAVC